MYCRNCGGEIADGSRFCSHCGSQVAEAPKPEPAEPIVHTEPVKADENEEVYRKPIFEEFQWNVSEYPDRNLVEKTEEINFNWNADPASIVDAPRRVEPAQVVTGQELEQELFKPMEPKKEPQEMSAAERIDKFYTFSSKNEEFQKLINSEYQRVKSGNAIEHEISQADKLAAERFETRPADSSMEAFLEKEGIVKPYQPKAFESDVLQRIEAQEAAREAQRLEEEARLAAIEEARVAAEAQKRAEAEARAKAEAEAARLEEIARRKAEEEARAAEAARIRAAEEARLAAEEEARLKAEADLKAAQEAAKIRAQQEARLAAEAEAQFKNEQEKKRLAAEEAQKQLEEKRRLLAQEADRVVAQEEARKVLEQTARLREQEEAKIRAAVAGLRGAGAAGALGVAANRDASDAHMATRNQINEMAKARDAFFADMDLEEENTNEKLVTGRETMLSSDEIARTRVIKKADIVAGINEPTRVADAKPAPAPVDDDEFFNSLDAVAEVEHEPQPIDFKEPMQPADDLEELLSQFEDLPLAEEQPMPEELPELFDVPEELPTEEPEAKPGLEDTVLMPQSESFDTLPANDFDSYGNDIVAQNNQPEPAGDFYEDGFYGEGEELSKKEKKQRAKEQKRLEKERAKEAKAAGKKAKSDYEEEYDDDEEEGGKGRIVLKIILAILIVVLAVEVVGMGIRFLAPQSKAAEFIDNQLNKVIQLITGEDTEYSVIAAQVRTEPMEDKTELIDAQKDKNINGNIQNIVYSSDLAYDQDTDGKISDLVLSTPMTVVEWGREDDNSPVYYDEQVIGQIIAYEAQMVEYRNNENEAILNMIDKEKSLYKDVTKLKGEKMSGEFKKLEIGEIRQAGTNYYVWVRETIGDTTTEKVYSMYPESKFVMKMAACYVV
ncbi:MAG: zinc-ribbon domain-containing protein [Bacillota bacterium]|nr:zinc-ribbon domain-containing protein [Bacillota bacterium]